jgi:hypothetical protein
LLEHFRIGREEAPTMTPMFTGGGQRSPAEVVVSGSELGPGRFPEVLAILSRIWRDTDPYLDDIGRVMENCAADMLVRISDGRIDGVLRSKRICTAGDSYRVPEVFEDLVGPYWLRRDPNPDTRILVDLTKLDGAAGVARSLIPFALARFTEPNLATFSPENAAALHTRFGARPVRRIEHARRRHSPPHVIVMCYRGFAASDRETRLSTISARP